MADITVTLPDGSTHTVSPDSLTLPEGVGLYGGDLGEPEGYTKADRFASELERRVEAKIRNGGYLKPDEAYSDEALKKVLRQRGIEVGDDLKPVMKLDPETLNRYKQDWAKDELEPVKTEVEALRTENLTLRRENVASRVQGALLGELKEGAFKPALPGTPSPFEALMGHFVRFDDEGKAFFQAGEGAMPEYDIEKAVLAYVKKHNADLLADKRQRGGGLDGKPGPGGGKVMSRADFERLAPAAQAAFVRDGGTITD